MSEIKVLGKNSDFRVVKMQTPAVTGTFHSISAYAIQNVDHETPGKHYTKRHYQVKLYADPVMYTESGGSSEYPWTYMSTLTLHLSGRSDTYVLQQDTLQTKDTHMLEWKGTIGQGDSLSVLIKRIDSNRSMNNTAVFYIQVS